MLNNEMAENYYNKAKEIYYRNFFILIERLSIKDKEKIDYNYELTIDELNSGLHTCITLFLKSLICKKNYLLLISNEHERDDNYVIKNFHKMPIIDGRKIYSLFTRHCINLVNINNDYNIHLDVLYNEGMEIRNAHYHSNIYNKNGKYNKILKSFLAINQIFLNNSFRRQIYRDIIRMLPYRVFKEKNIGDLKSNETLHQNYEDNKNNKYIMYDYARYLYFKIVINIFEEITEPSIRCKLFNLKNYDKRLTQYYCPNCTVYNLNYLSASEYSHNHSLLIEETIINKNMKSLISVNILKSLFKCICCNDVYIVKNENKVSICNHEDDSYHISSVIKKPEEHYMIDNVCLYCGREHFGEVKFRKRNVYIVKNHINKTDNFKLDTPLFWDSRQVYVYNKRRFKYLRRRRNKLIYKGII